jgi:hypothetical protein
LEECFVQGETATQDRFFAATLCLVNTSIVIYLYGITKLIP